MSLIRWKKFDLLWFQLENNDSILLKIKYRPTHFKESEITFKIIFKV